MFVLPSLDSKYYSLDIKDFISLEEMLCEVPEEEYPTTEAEFKELMYCFNIKLD